MPGLLVDQSGSGLPRVREYLRVWIIRRASRSQKELLRRLMELHLYDVSRVDGRTPGADGTFGYAYFDAYWKEPGRYPYLIRADGQWVGFALVNKWSPLPGADWAVAEFFVLAPYRRRGIGERAARALFARHKGVWHVAQLRENRAAIAFWRKVIGRSTSSRYKEVNVRSDLWTGPVQIFDSRGWAYGIHSSRSLGG